MKFIKTQDEELAKSLRLSGYKELKKQGKFFVFVNNSAKYTFSVEDEKKVVFTNSLCL